MSLAKRVRDIRYAKGWGPDELASRAEISRTALYQIESGKTELPRAGTLRRIAKALGVSIDVLMGNAEVGTFQLSSFAQGATEPETGAEWARGHDDASARPVEGHAGPEREAAPSFPATGHMSYWSAPSRERELTRKLHELLNSPLGEGVARIVEESYRMLPIRHAQ